MASYIESRVLKGLNWGGTASSPASWLTCPRAGFGGVFLPCRFDCCFAMLYESQRNLMGQVFNHYRARQWSLRRSFWCVTFA
jgi:hypothetical protein